MKIVFVITAAAAAALLTVAVVTGSDLEPGSKAAEPEASASVPPRSEAQAPPPRRALPRDDRTERVAVRAGLRARYDLRLRQALSLEQGTEQTGMTFEIRGELVATVVDADIELVRIVAELRHATVTTTTDAPEDATTAQLQAPFFVDFARDGRVVGFRFSPTVSSDARDLLRQVAASMQLSIPDGAPARWKATEQDTTGTYEAAYVRRSADTIERRRRRYLSVPTTRGPQPAEARGRFELGGRTTYTVGRDLVPARVQVDESVTFTSSGSPFEVRTAVHLDAALLDLTFDMGAAVAGYAARAAAQPTAVAVAPAVRAHHDVDEDRRVADGADFDDIVRMLAELPDRDDPNSPALRALHGQAAAVLRLDDDAVERAAEVARTEDDEVTVAYTIAALGTAGTPAAQRALGDLLGDGELAPLKRVRSAVALGLTGEPTEETFSGLGEALSIDDPALRQTAALAAGNALSNGARARGEATEPDEALGLLDQLITGLGAATSTSEQIMYLDALGNAGDPRALDAIAPFLSHPAAEVRSVAVLALRFMPLADVAGTLSAALLADPSPLARMAAAKAIGIQPTVAYADVLGSSLAAEQHPDVRAAVVTVVQDHAHESAALAALAPAQAATAGAP